MGIRIMAKNPRGRPVGYKMSDESKALVGAASKGRIPRNRRRIIIEGTEFDSIRIAARELKLPIGTVRSRVLSDTNTFEQWKFL